MSTGSLRPGRVSAASDSDDRKRLYPLADQIRTAYIRAYRRYFLARNGVPSDFGSRPMPRWDGGQASDGRHYQPIWYKIARVAVHHGIAPDDLIAAAFHGRDGKVPPWPTNLIGEETIAYAKANPAITVDDARRALVVQREIWRLRTFVCKAERGCDLAEAARAALRDVTLELSSVFRHCMAVENGDGETAGMFEDGALRQYARNRRVYDEAWGDLIPARLRGLADLLNIS